MAALAIGSACAPAAAPAPTAAPAAPAGKPADARPAAPAASPAAQGGGAPAYKEVIRGDAAKAWMDKEVSPKKAYVIGTSLPNMPDPAWQSVWYGVQSQGKKLGLDMRIADAGGFNKLDVQVSQLENFIQLKVDAIIVGGINADGVAPILQRAGDAGIKIIDAFLIENSGRTTSRVINDQAEIGAAEASFLGQALNGQGGVVMLNGPAGNQSLVQRAEGFKEALKAFPGMKVLGERFSDINRPEGLKQMEDLLQAFPGQVKGVYSGGSFLADGAADAVLAKGGAEKVLIATASPNAGTVERIKQGEIHMTADQQNVMQGRIAVNVAVTALNGDPVPDLIVPPIRALTAENIGSVDWALSLPPADWKP